MTTMLSHPTRQEQLQNRIAAFDVLKGKTIAEVTVHDRATIEVRFADGALLTLAAEDSCGGHRTVVETSKADLAGETFLAYELAYIKGVINKQRQERVDITRFILSTTNRDVLFDLLLFHTSLTCPRFAVRWKVALVGTNYEGAY